MHAGGRMQSAAPAERPLQPPGRVCRDVQRGGIGAEREETPQHRLEQAGKRQVGPAGIGGAVHQNEEAFALAPGGHERRSIGKRRPDSRSVISIAFAARGEQLFADGRILGSGKTCKRTSLREGGDPLRLLPGKGAAERTCAGT